MSPAAVTPATIDTAASAPPPKNLSPALARAMARRQQARQAAGAATPSPAAVPAGAGAEDARTPAAQAPSAHAPVASPHTPEAIRRDHVMADEEEDYGEVRPAVPVLSSATAGRTCERNTASRAQQRVNPHCQGVAIHALCWQGASCVTQNRAVMKIDSAEWEGCAGGAAGG